MGREATPCEISEIDGEKSGVDAKD